MGSKASGKTYSHESRVGRDQRVDADLGVDVEHTVVAARRPHSAVNAEGVGLLVVVVEGTDEVGVAISLQNIHR